MAEHEKSRRGRDWRRLFRFRSRLRELLGVAGLEQRVHNLEDQLGIQRGPELDLDPGSAQLADRARRRWQEAQPNVDLAWGEPLDGRAFVVAAAGYGVFGEDRSILEVGPGYGRLLQAALSEEIAFGPYHGLDLSMTNVEYLRKLFPQPKVHFHQGDAHSAKLGRTFDAVISSLTFKHFFPTFEGVLENLRDHLVPEGLLCFDLVQGRGRYFEADGVTYLRFYERDEVQGLLETAGFRLVTFDRIWHSPDRPRLLVVARAQDRQTKTALKPPTMSMS